MRGDISFCVFMRNACIFRFFNKIPTRFLDLLQLNFFALFFDFALYFFMVFYL